MANIGDLSVRIDADTSGLERGAQRGRQELNELGGGMERVTGIAQKLTGVLAAMGAGIGFANAIREIANFQAAMNGLAAVSGATEQQMASLESQARTLGATSRFSAQQAAEGQRFLAQAGFSVNETLGATPGILQLATAAELDLGTAADIASNVLGGMRLEVDQLNRVNDVLAATASRSNTSISQLGQALSFAAPFAAGAGISIEEAAAAIGNMSDAGIQASRAGTGLVGTIRQLSNVTDAGEDVLGRYGLSVADVNIEARGLQPVLETLRQANLSTADAIALFGSEAGAAAQVLVNDYNGAIEDATGEAERMANQLNQGLGPAFRSLQSAISESVLQLGDSGLSGALEDLIRTSTGVISVFNGMGEEWADANDSGEDLAITTESLSSAIGVMSSVANEDAVRAMASLRDSWAEADDGGKGVLDTVEGIATALEVLATLAGARLVAAMGSYAGSVAVATQQSIAYQAALARMAGVSRTAAVATGAMRGALALMGGPLGLLVGAGGLLFAFREELGLVPRPAAEVEQHLDGITRATDDLNDAMLDLRVAAFGAELVQLGTQAEVLSQRMATLNRVATDPTSFGQGMQGDIQTGIAQTEQELENTQNRIEAIQQGMERIRDLRRGDRGEDGEGGGLPGRTDTPVVSTGDGADTEDEDDPARFMGGIGIFGEEENQAFIERLKAQLEMRQEILREFDVLDTERQQEKFEADMERLREALELKAITEQEFRDAQLEAERNYWSKRFGITQDAESGITSLVEGFNDRRIDSYATAFDSILNSMAEHSKAAFNIQKGLALASATIDAYKAITGAYKVGASIGGPPLGAAFAAAAGAAQFATIANIASQQYSATSGGSSGGARGAASSGGGSVAGAQAAQQQQSQPDQNTIVTIQGLEGDTLLSSKQVRGLLEQINEAVENGAKIRIAN